MEEKIKNKIGNSLEYMERVKVYNEKERGNKN